jgi:outer membrane protein assembly factor BamB
MVKECTYYKRVRLLRIAIVLAMMTSFVAAPAASNDDPVPITWPVSAAWPKAFPLSDAISVVMGDSRVFVAQPTQVSAFQWSDGAELWKANLTATTRPVIDEGRVFVSAGDGIHALSESTGAEQWRLAVGAMSLSPAAKAGWLVVADTDGSLQAINASQGREVWRIDLPAALTVPAVIEGDLVIGACADGVVRAWQIADNAVRWTRELGTRPTQILAASGHVFVGGEDGRLFSLRPRDGHQNWEYKLEITIVGRLAADNEHVYATTIDNSVQAHSFNGHRAWHRLLASRVVDGLYVDSGMVFVPQSNGAIQLYLARDGARAGRVTAPPAEATVLGGLVAFGVGDRLQMALTMSAGSELKLTTFRRTGLAAVPATAAPPSTELLLTRPTGSGGGW